MDMTKGKKRLEAYARRAFTELPQVVLAVVNKKEAIGASFFCLIHLVSSFSFHSPLR